MIEAKGIDITALQSFPLSDRKQIPNKSAIYLLTDGNDALQYIGKSFNPRFRWAQHVRAGLLNFSKISKIKMHPCHCREHHQLEKALIGLHNPPQNTQYRTDLLALVEVPDKEVAA